AAGTPARGAPRHPRPGPRRGRGGVLLHGSGDVCRLDRCGGEPDLRARPDGIPGPAPTADLSRRRRWRLRHPARATWQGDAVTALQRLGERFWFVPAVLCLAAVIVAELLIWTDQNLQLSVPGWAEALLYRVGESGSRDILGAIA